MCGGVVVPSNPHVVQLYAGDAFTTKAQFCNIKVEVSERSKGCAVTLWEAKVMH
jgi:hypothetical protein